MATVEFDLSEWREFFDKLSRAGLDLKEEAPTWLEAIGVEFLGLVEDEIIDRGVTDTRLLLHSFTRGDANNCWEVTDEGLTLEVGTHVDYASYVNDGHWANPKGVETRFVPGVWNGDKFEYIPGAKTGMVLKQQWVKETLYWDSALRIMEKMFPALVEAKLQQWLDRYFG